MRHLTIRNLPDRLGRALESEKRQRGQSLNRTVIDLLARALGLGPEPRSSNGLADLAGTWSPAEQAQFENDVAVTEQIDEELWR